MTRRYRIAAIPGDGIGPEVMRAGVSVLKTFEETGSGIAFDFVELKAGDDNKRATGVALPEETVREVERADACLFAAVGDTAKEVILPLRQNLDLFANVRPAKVYPNVPHIKDDIDLVIVRENTEDLYKRIGFQGPDWGVALRIITRQASDRIAKFAFELAERDERNRVACVHKANVLDTTDNIFIDSCRRMAKDHPSIEYEETLVDACAMRLVLAPERFDVIVTTNMFGDILSDEAAGLVGGLGMAPSGNFGDEKAIFEPVHGSAPDIAGKGIANPIAMILTAGMMLEWLGEAEAASLIEDSVIEVLKEKRTLTPDLGGSSRTDEVAAAVQRRIRGKKF